MAWDFEAEPEFEELLAWMGEFIDGTFRHRAPVRITPMVGGGSCGIFAVDRGADG
jgi:hypothetical protein